MSQKKDDRPLTFRVAGWYAFIFAAVFLIYGGIKVILGILDHNYGDMVQPIIFGLIGILLIAVAFAYREVKAWGWYGLTGVNCLVILLALIGYNHIENIVLILFSVIALGALFSPQTKQYVFRKR
jgi:hypothetical protein